MDDIKEFIKQGKLEEAIERLIELSPNEEIKDEAIHLSYRLSEYKKQERRGFNPNSDEPNQIAFSALELIREFEENDTDVKKTTEEKIVSSVTNDIAQKELVADKKLSARIKFLVPILFLFLLGTFIVWFVNSKFVQINLAQDNGSTTLDEQEKNASPDNPEIAYIDFTDPRDANIYKTFSAKDGNIWMAENLRYYIEGKSFFPDGKKENKDTFGLLYSWDVAMKACPKGWQLPSDEIWQKFAFEYGGFQNLGGLQHGDAAEGYKNLMDGGDSGFNANLSGMRYGEQFFNIETTGAYWTSTQISPMEAAELPNKNVVWLFDFLSQEKKLIRIYDEKTHGHSCRCIKEKK